MRSKTEHQQRVEEFMVKAKQEIPDRPTLPDEKTRRLRAKLILEEALETVRELGFHLVVSGMHDDETIDLTDKETFRKHVFPETTQAGPSLEGIADGCCDIIVVTSGTLSACGIADDSVQREVDCNNLRKFEHHCPKCDGPGREAASSEAPGRRICDSCRGYWRSGYHNEAGKWVKPETHKPPRIMNVLEEQTKAVTYYDEAKQLVAAVKAEKITRRESGACFGEDFHPVDDVCRKCIRRTECVEAFIGPPSEAAG